MRGPIMYTVFPFAYVGSMSGLPPDASWDAIAVGAREFVGWAGPGCSHPAIDIEASARAVLVNVRIRVASPWSVKDFVLPSHPWNGKLGPGRGLLVPPVGENGTAVTNPT